MDFSCFGYHPDLESRLTIQEKWVLGAYIEAPHRLTNSAADRNCPSPRFFLIYLDASSLDPFRNVLPRSSADASWGAICYPQSTTALYRGALTRKIGYFSMLPDLDAAHSTILAESTLHRATMSAMMFQARHYIDGLTIFGAMHLKHK
ncbi:hypothetical protein GWG65_38525 [Bradyrhizobium sp. CSA207]|nr:hypothetical protein [Bradyrhizobium sp. CSA207]